MNPTAVDHTINPKVGCVHAACAVRPRPNAPSSHSVSDVCVRIECIYDRRNTTRNLKAPISWPLSSPRPDAAIGTEIDDDGAVPAGPTRHLDLSIRQDRALDIANAPNWDLLNPIVPSECSFEPLVNVDVPDVTSTAFVFGTSAVMANGQSVHPHDSLMDTAPQRPRRQSSRFEYFPLQPGLTDWNYYPEIPYLKPLPKTDRVARQYALTVIRTIRGYPQMMLRQDTFPPFIHTCMYGASDDASAMTLPTPLANCVSIAHIFALRTDETKQFLWDTIAAELRNNTDQTCHCRSV